jgi:surfactin synthase thioesterase subunit
MRWPDDVAPGPRDGRPGSLAGLVAVEPRERPRARLFFFPHAGGGPSAGSILRDLLPPYVEPWVVSLPGRQGRQDEAAATDLGEVVADLAGALDRLDDLPYALFGYCAGALAALLVARRCRPGRLFVGSFAAPDIAHIPRRVHLLPHDAFWTAVLGQGGIPPQLARHEELRPVFEPVLRQDFALYAGYRHRAAEPMDVPITVLAGRDDPHLGSGALLGWRRQTRHPLDLCRLPGGHWLLDANAGELVAAIADRMLADLRRRPAMPSRAGA